MKVSESIRHYDAGTLEQLTTKTLINAHLILIDKIKFMREVAKQQNIALEIYADIRKYEAVYAGIKKVLDGRVLRRYVHFQEFRFGFDKIWVCANPTV